MIRHVFALAVVLLLSGCLGGGRSEPVRILDLPLPTQAAVGPTLDAQLALDEPRAGQSLDVARIVVRPEASELRYYAGARWRDRAPKLLHDALLRAFEDAEAFRAVGRSGNGLRGDLSLLVELRRFDAVYRAGTPQAELELQATLLDQQTGVALGSRRFEASVPADGTAIDAVVDAFGAATGQALDALVRWTRQTAADREARDAGHTPL